MAVATKPVEELFFSVPQIGPKVYITRGPSGWTETFSKAKSDAELLDLVAPVLVSELVDLFLIQREATKTPTDWYTVTGFLGRMTERSPKAIPIPAAIAFWAAVVIASTGGKAG